MLCTNPGSRELSPNCRSHYGSRQFPRTKGSGSGTASSVSATTSCICPCSVVVPRPPTPCAGTLRPLYMWSACRYNIHPNLAPTVYQCVYQPHESLVRAVRATTARISVTVIRSPVRRGAGAGSPRAFPRQLLAFALARCSSPHRRPHPAPVLLRPHMWPVCA